jgi:hypothetical protein
MATQTVLLSATSKRGCTRSVEAEIVAGKLVGTFKRVEPFGDEAVSWRIPLRGDLNRLANFATRQPGLFIKWVDSKFGLK